MAVENNIPSVYGGIFALWLTLEPLGEFSITARQGLQAYAMFLDIINTTDSTLAAWLHDTDATKPVTLSPLFYDLKKYGRNHSHYSLKITFLSSSILQRFLEGIDKKTDKTVVIGQMSFKIKDFCIMGEGNYTPQQNTYLSIVCRAAYRRSISLIFSSPTAFRSAGKRNVVFPQPELVFGSYLSKWNAFSHIKFDEGLREIFSRDIITTRYRLETRMLDFGRYQEVGFVGRCTFLIAGTVSREALTQINALADFACYCGTGAKTTMGMGQTRRLKDARSLTHFTV